MIFDPAIIQKMSGRALHVPFAGRPPTQWLGADVAPVGTDWRSSTLSYRPNAHVPIIGSKKTIITC